MSQTAERERETFEQSVRGVPHRTLPILDLASLVDGDTASIRNLADNLRQILSEIGFLCVVNHGVPPSVITGLIERSAEFFALPEATKTALAINRHERGYTPMNVEVIQDSDIGGASRNDRNEAFNFGMEYPADDPNVISGKRMYGANVWPESVPGYDAAAREYMAHMERLSKRLLPVWEVALGLEPHHFDASFESAHSYVRTIRYPGKAVLDVEELGIRPHVDTSFMTLLPRENEPGLQVMDADGEWFWPDCPEGGIVVNFGLYIERLSNEVVRATPHRVIPPVTGTRYSLPFFMCPRLEAVVECLPTCCGPDNPPRYQPESFWNLHTDRMSKIYPHFAAKEGEG
ncbi:MAG: isopenicillin N synthase family oxygenase [Alphaproteobacteria bacterium]|nr:isopenicillin N synthase family oxygenase [Alphaproteobacteria bacterium]